MKHTLIVVLLLALSVAGAQVKDTLKISKAQLDIALYRAFYSPWNVKEFGATGVGVVDDRAPIQAALDSAHAHGGGVVYIPAGTYLVGQSTIYPGLGLRANLITYTNVTIVGSGMHSTIIKRANSQPDMQCMILNFDVFGRDSGLVVRDLMLDGNGANQVVVDSAQRGIYLYGASDITITNVAVKNIRYVNSGISQGESFEFELGLCDHATFDNCIAYGGPNSATGFSASYSYDVRYANCESRQNAMGRGFTNYQSHNLQYVNCTAILNGDYGFNNEYSRNISYTNCMSGGYSFSDRVYGTHNMGNGYDGFYFLQDTSVVLNNVFSVNNGHNGIYLTKYCDSVFVNGGGIVDNYQYGIWSDTTAHNLFITSEPMMNGNILGKFDIGGSPFYDYQLSLRTRIIAGPSITNGTRSNFFLRDTASYAAGVGGGIAFEGKYNVAGAYLPLCGVQGYKENAVDGDYSGQLGFWTTSYSKGLPAVNFFITSGGVFAQTGAASDSAISLTGGIKARGVKLSGNVWLLPGAKPATPASGVIYYTVAGSAGSDTVRVIDHFGNIKTIMP